jgi:anhydro-N-acetylmuramic acid kinase
MDNGEAFTIYASGGGAHNAVLMARIRENLGATVKLIDELGISGDAKEAVLFAVLANEAIAGTDSFFGEKDGVPGVSMGKISFPG